MKNILIVFGSRFGNTKEVAAEIAKVAEEAGTKVDVVDLKETKRKDWPSVENYDGIIVGSGVKIMKWTKQPLAFLKKNKNQLNKKTLGLFATAAFALVDLEKAKLDYGETIAKDIGLQPRIHDAFGPVMDFSENSNLGAMNKGILKLAAMGIRDETGIEINTKGYNDLRDWEQIKAFAKNFVELVKKE
ncbi:MAG: flavodoxin domain-containing protein [Candidatus Heimdallarchaeota archaeon]